MLKSEQIKDKLESLEKVFDAAEKDCQYWYDTLEETQKRYDAAEGRVEDIQEEIYDLEEELVEAIREEATDPAELERYHASQDKRQEDLDL
jgi:predicted  nucleic acid-binding Zn-ribbon protein